MFSKRLFLFLVFLSSIYFLGHAQNKVELEKQRVKLLREISETEDILNNTKKEHSESLERLNLLDKKISLRNEAIDNLDLEIKSVDEQIIEIQKNVHSLDEDVSSMKREYARMIYLSYLNREPNNQFMFILSSKDFNQGYKRILYLKQYTDNRKRQLAIIRNVESEYLVQLEILRNTRKEKEHLVANQKVEKENCVKEMDEKKLVVDQLKHKEKDLAKKLKEDNRVAEKLQHEINAIILAATRVKSTPEHARMNVEMVDEKLGNDFRDNKGKLPWPTDQGIISNCFGDHPHPIYKGVTVRNNGIDISCREGSDVRCIFEGEVKAVFGILGSNFFVIVRHGNFLTVYQNIINVNVKVGDKVKTKQIIGKVFTDGDTRSSILHLEILEEKKRLDPELWLAKK